MSNRLRRLCFTALTYVAASAFAVLGTLPTPASAEEQPALQFSYDGIDFLPSLPRGIFTTDQPILIPGGQPAVDTFYVRNGSSDPAELTVRSTPKRMDETNDASDWDILSVKISLGETPSEQLVESHPGLSTSSVRKLEPGETAKVRVAISLRWELPDTTDGDIGQRMVIDPGLTVDLRQWTESTPPPDAEPTQAPDEGSTPTPDETARIINHADPEHSADKPNAWLADTGARNLFVMIAIGLGSVVFGAFLVRRRRKAESEHE